MGQCQIKQPCFSLANKDEEVVFFVIFYIVTPGMLTEQKHHVYL